MDLVLFRDGEEKGEGEKTTEKKKEIYNFIRD